MDNASSTEWTSTSNVMRLFTEKQELHAIGNTVQ